MGKNSVIRFQSGRNTLRNVWGGEGGGAHPHPGQFLATPLLLISHFEYSITVPMFWCEQLNHTIDCLLYQSNIKA